MERKCIGCDVRSAHHTHRAKDARGGQADFSSARVAALVLIPEVRLLKRLKDERALGRLGDLKKRAR